MQEPDGDRLKEMSNRAPLVAVYPKNATNSFQPLNGKFICMFQKKRPAPARTGRLKVWAVEKGDKLNDAHERSIQITRNRMFRIVLVVALLCGPLLA